MNATSSPIIVFDLDGTLVHSAPDLLDSLNHSLTLGGYQPVTLSDLNRFVGQGGQILVERALTKQNIDITTAPVAFLLKSFLDHYSANIPGKTRYFDGVDEALDILTEQGFLLSVCTNKTERLAKELLDEIEQKRRFSAICGGDSFAWRKPDGRYILSTIEEAGGNPTRAIMVGDSAADIDAAKSAGIPVIAVDFGYTDIPVTHLNPPLPSTASYLNAPSSLQFQDCYSIFMMEI